MTSGDSTFAFVDRTSATGDSTFVLVDSTFAQKRTKSTEGVHGQRWLISHMSCPSTITIKQACTVHS
jgi:hypothetical protein